MQRPRRKPAAATPAERRALLKRLPAVSKLLDSRPFAPVLRRFGAVLATDLLREALAETRRGILDGTSDEAALRGALSATALAATVTRAGDALLAPRPRRVVNATGIVVHTNLGRSLLSADAAAQVAELSAGYVDLEYDVDAARRGSRMSHLAPLMGRLFPGHDFHVLNNNAAAVMLCLKALSRRKEVPISRGELVEIGGSFRVPDIMAASGAKLVEVGTTNRTRLKDYADALSAKTGVILKVHTSNFKIVGFTEETPLDKLAALAKKSDVPLLVDWGSGDLADLAPLGIRDELPVSEVLAAGADLVTFSGDKLLGGPQAGFIVGRRDLVEKIRKDPLSRVCRLDRLLVGALQRTLAAYVRGTAMEEIPTLRMLAATPAEIERRAVRVKRAVAKATGQGSLLSVIDGISRTGGGSSPAGERPTRLLAVASPSGDAGGIERRLRAGSPPVIGRMQEGKLLLDLRTVVPEEDATLTEALVGSLTAGS